MGLETIKQNAVPLSIAAVVGGLLLAKYIISQQEKKKQNPNDYLSGPCPDVTQEDIDRIQATWDHVRKINPKDSGALLFKNIFLEAGEGGAALAGMWDFSRDDDFDMNDLDKSQGMRKHGASVILTAQYAIDRLDDVTRLIPVVKELGARHNAYGTVSAHYPVVGAALLRTLSMALPAEVWADPKVQESFKKFWGFTAYYMLAGQRELDEKS